MREGYNYFEDQPKRKIDSQLKDRMEFYELLLNNSSIPTSHRSCVLTRKNEYTSPFDFTFNAVDNDAYIYFLSYDPSAKKRIYICGNVGTGKTHLAIAVQKRFMWNYGAQSIFITQLELNEILRNQYNEDNKNRRLSQLTEVDHLLIDDFGQGNFTPIIIESMELLIMRRLERGKLTDYTTNLKETQILELFSGRRIMSRIKQSCKFFKLRGKDYREHVPF